MLNFIRNKLTALVVAVLTGIAYVLANFKHHPLDSTAKARLKSIYLIPTAILMIPALLAYSVVRASLAAVASLVLLVALVLADIVSAFWTAIKRTVIGVPKFAYELWTHEPMHPFDYLLKAILAGAR